MAESKLPKSQHFADQIRQLELEGSKLMAATHELGDSLLGFGGSSNNMDGTYTARSVSPSIRALADISAEQRTIDEMRHQLDAQSKETERLTKDYLGDSAGFRYSNTSSLLDRLDIPSSRTSHRSYGSGLVHTGTENEDFQYMGRSQLERELREAKRDVSSLRSQISETIGISEKQKEHFRMSIEELRGKLQEALVSKDTLIDAKKRESAGQEAMVYKLQQTADQLQQANNRQEESLQELLKKNDTLQREQYTTNMSLSQVRSLLMDQERRRGRPFYDGDSLTLDNSALLCRAIEKCIQELDTELQMKNKRNMQLGSELENLKALSEDKQRMIALDNQDRLSQLHSEHDKQLDVANERALNAKQQVSTLQEQIQIIQRQTDQQLKLKEEYIKELEQRLQTYKDDHDDEKRSWKEKREALEMACDETQKELSLLKKEREDTIRKTAVLESRYTDMQQTILKLEKESDSYNCERLKLLDEEKEFKIREENFIVRIKEKDGAIEDLKKAIDSIKLECNSQLQQTVANVEKETKFKAADENKSLASQLTSATEKSYKLQVDLELAKSQNENLKEKYDELKVEHNTLKEQLQLAQSSKDHFSDLCQNRSEEVNRYSQEKDKYFKLMEERTAEMMELKSVKEKLTIQLEEREKNFLSLQQQHDKVMETMDNNSKNQGDLKGERDELLRRMNEKIIETEEIRHGRDNISKKLQVREKHIQELQGDNTKLAEELKGVRTECERSVAEKDSLFNELKQSRYEVSTLQEELRAAQQRLEANQGDMGKDINKLAKKLKATEHDLKLARKAMKSREHVDDTAVKVAGKMQKEVTEKRSQLDALQSRIRWLEDCLDANTKDKRIMKEENENLTKTVKKSVEQTERLRSEIQEYMKKNSTLKDKVAKMEAALEKAAVKHAASQAQIEQYEQDLARLKLKHQLELKEQERVGRSAQPDQKLIGAPSSAHCTNTREHALDEHTINNHPQASDSQVGEDLRQLISEMRSVLSSHTPRNSALPSTDSPRNHVSSTTCTTDDYLPLRKPPSYHGNLEEERRAAERLMAKYQNMTMESGAGDSFITQNFSLPAKSLTTRSTFPNSRPAGKPLASVSDLLASEIQLLEAESNGRRAMMLEDDLLPTKQKEGSDDPVNTDLQTQELCKRLEKKIENLSKIGTHLEKENKEISRTMKDHDRKLKKVKSQWGK